MTFPTLHRLATKYLNNSIAATDDEFDDFCCC